MNNRLGFLHHAWPVLLFMAALLGIAALCAWGLWLAFEGWRLPA